jgi:phosphatidylglycerol:prolipoprotein diacylglycerol transferase
MNQPLMWPHFSPILFQIGPFAIHYYALAYIVALLIGWQLVRRLAALPPVAATGEQVDDFLTWATLGIILGGRLGYVLLYQPVFFLTHPARIIAVWDGGMSFHGGCIGVTIAIIWFCRKNHIFLLRFADRIAVAVPIGLFLGRIANFINGELWGRAAAPWFPWPMIYPQSGSMVPRYPSELIEASLEGIVLFCVMFAASRSEKLRSAAGALTGLFLAGYGIARITGEFFREPDAFLGFLPFGVTMGQVLSVPMVILGTGLFFWATRPGLRPGHAGAERPQTPI